MHCVTTVLPFYHIIPHFIDPKKAASENNFTFDENGSKFSKRVENGVRKGEIAHCKQFLPFPQCFTRTCNADTQNQGLVRERVNYHLIMPTILTCLHYCSVGEELTLPVTDIQYHCQYSILSTIILSMGNNYCCFQKVLPHSPNF